MYASTYKENLLQNARYTAGKVNGQCRVSWKGNKRYVTLIAMSGRSCQVWYPVEARVNDLEIQDLKDAMQFIFGVEAFSI